MHVQEHYKIEYCSRRLMIASDIHCMLSGYNILDIAYTNTVNTIMIFKRYVFYCACGSNATSKMFRSG